MKINIAYFSATNTTQAIVTAVGRVISTDTLNYNLTNKPLVEDLSIPSDEMLLVGMPVYGGRIPNVAVKSLQRFKGNHTPAIIIAVYGNREFEDALVEMQDILEDNGFSILAAGAFIAQHSVFPHTAKGRPDKGDYEKITVFAEHCKKLLEQGSLATTQRIQLPGNHPYKIPGNIPLKVVTDSTCLACQTCIRTCPVQAIPKDNPRVTDYEKCIHCGRCIYVCPTKARHYKGPLYQFAGAMFHWKNRKRKEPQFFFCR